jgi:hypothetical protein
MIAMATWILVVKLQSPIHQQETQQWDRRYTAQTAEECEQLAYSNWRSYYIAYPTQELWERTLTTTCSATSAHHEYKWFITCDKTGGCRTDKIKEIKR